jgi:CTP synthase (UTP-ammonia lyase)
MPEVSRTHMGGTMRLGLRPTLFQQDSDWSRVRKLYGGASTVWERHRHRYEVNPTYVERLHTSGMAFIGRDEKGERMQIMELPSASSALTVCTQPVTIISLLFPQITPFSLACRRTQNSARVRSIRLHHSSALSQRLVDPMSLRSR